MNSCGMIHVDAIPGGTGVNRVGPPACLMAGGVLQRRIACFRDPDGTVLELVEARCDCEVTGTPRV